MSTRAVITFKDKDSEYHVYDRYDGYPCARVGAIAKIHKSCELAWSMPRFDPSEFACAYIAANKKSEGSIYLTNNWKQEDFAYRYVVTEKKGKLHVTAYTWNGNGKLAVLFKGAIDTLVWALDQQVEFKAVHSHLVKAILDLPLLQDYSSLEFEYQRFVDELKSLLDKKQFIATGKLN